MSCLRHGDHEQCFAPCTERKRYNPYDRVVQRRPPPLPGSIHLLLEVLMSETNGARLFASNANAPKRPVRRPQDVVKELDRRQPGRGDTSASAR